MSSNDYFNPPLEEGSACNLGNGLHVEFLDDGALRLFHSSGSGLILEAFHVRQLLHFIVESRAKSG
jgi:hypothetical protein